LGGTNKRVAKQLFQKSQTRTTGQERFAEQDVAATNDEYSARQTETEIDKEKSNFSTQNT